MIAILDCVRIKGAYLKFTRNGYDASSFSLCAEVTSLQSLLWGMLRFSAPPWDLGYIFTSAPPFPRTHFHWMALREGVLGRSPDFWDFASVWGGLWGGDEIGRLHGHPCGLLLTGGPS